MIKKLALIILFMLVFSVSIYTCVAIPDPPPPPTSLGGLNTASNEYEENNTENNNPINTSNDIDTPPENPDSEWIDVTCNNKVKDGYESDVDCGGYCIDCANGKSCILGLDCESKYCNPNNICSVPSCNDGWMNGEEVGFDCGGSCGKCNEDSSCTTNSDCKSAYCNPNKICSQPSCEDGWKNGDETEIDCGGSCISCSGMAGDINEDDNEDEPVPAPPIETEKPEEIENDSDGISLFLVLFIILSVLVIGLIVYYIINKHPALPIESKKTETIQTTPISLPETQQEHAPIDDVRHSRLKAYISTYLQKGYHPDTLKQSLMSYNWQEQEIDDVLNELKNGSGDFFQSKMGR